MLQRGRKATEEASRIACVNAWDGNILGNNCPRSYYHVITDRDREDCGICSDTHTIAKFGRPPKLWLPSRSTVAEEIVDKHGAMRNEAVVPNRDQIANERVGLDPATLPDLCPFLDFNERPDERFIADFTTV